MLVVILNAIMAQTNAAFATRCMLKHDIIQLPRDALVQRPCTTVLPRKCSTFLCLSRSDDSDNKGNESDFFDGYDEFINSLENDMATDNFNVYDNSDILEGRTKGGFRKGKDQRTSSETYRRDPTDNVDVVVDEATVYQMLERRSSAQQQRDYDLADQIRDQLNRDYGVFVWDKDKMWTTNPVAPNKRKRAAPVNYSTSSIRKPKEFGRFGHDYVQIGNDLNPETCSLTMEQIHALLAKRLEFKLLRQYDNADAIQSELYENGVKVHDGFKQWRADGGIFSDVDTLTSGRKFFQSEYSEPLVDTSNLATIEELVAKRAEARKRRNYDMADKVRGELWDIYRVAVDDKSLTWSVGGDFGANGTFRWTDNGPASPRSDDIPTSRSREKPVYTQSPYSKPLSTDSIEDDEEEIRNLIHDRLEARRVKDYTVADEIRDYLFQRFNISVDDKLRQWSIGGDFGEEGSMLLRADGPTSSGGASQQQAVQIYHRRGGVGDLTEENIAMVDAMVQRRAEELSRYNRKAAKSIEAGLRQEFNVAIDDRSGEWHIRGNEYVLTPLFKGSLPTALVEARAVIEDLIAERARAKTDKNFDRADEIRSHLFETYGITLDDRVREWSVVVRGKGSASVGQVHSDDDGISPNMKAEWGSLLDDDDEVHEASNELETDGKMEVDNGEVTLSTTTFESLTKLTVFMLKEKLRAAGLPVSGKKTELIERLLNNN